MTAPAVPGLVDEAQQLLEAMLCSPDPLERWRAYCRLDEMGLAGATVVDELCGDDDGPVLMPVWKLPRHILRMANHTPGNVRWGSLDEPGSGPARKAGPA